MATDKATLSVLKTFADLLDGGEDTVSPAVLAFFPTVIEVCTAASIAIAEDIVDVMESMAQIPACHDIMQSQGARQLLENVASRCGSRSLKQRIATVIATMEGSVHACDPTPLIPAKSVPTVSAPAASRPATISAPVLAPTTSSRRELITLQLNMDNLLGVRDEEDEYIRALLMLDGVTSVTLDRKREVALVFTHDAGIKPQLYACVQETCDALQDARGKPRFVLRGEHAAYLEDDGGAEDFFAPGAKHALARAGGAKAGGETVEERIRRREAAEAAKAGGWLSWLKW